MPQHEPTRRCILSGEAGGRDDLLRLALGPDGEVLPDVHARAPGRGAWITPDRALIAQAQAKRRLSGALMRAFKDPAVRVPADLVAQIESGLARAALDRLGLELRAGHLIFGHDRVADALRCGRARLLLHAADAGADGADKLDRLAGGRVERLRLPADRLRLSMALGRENVVHAAVCDAGAARRVADSVRRWCAFLGTELNEAAAGPSPVVER